MSQFVADIPPKPVVNGFEDIRATGDLESCILTAENYNEVEKKVLRTYAQAYADRNHGEERALAMVRGIERVLPEKLPSRHEVMQRLPGPDLAVVDPDLKNVGMADEINSHKTVMRYMDSTVVGRTTIAILESRFCKAALKEGEGALPGTLNIFTGTNELSCLYMYSQYLLAGNPATNAFCLRPTFRQGVEQLSSWAPENIMLGIALRVFRQVAWYGRPGRIIIL